jgi:indolepyruvate decarboxylase
VWNYVLLAEALGGKGFSVATTSELETALGEVERLVDVPALIAVRIKDRDVPKELRPTGQSGTAAFERGPDRTPIAEAGFN